ncbi:MAG: hypothetical protein JWM68_4359 [Verrucomicrobiales bacterium]|nr:hypothetical protein [Verrucomicrobiales bacterium]
MAGISNDAFNASKGLEEHEEELDVKYCTSVVLNAARALAFAAALLFNNAKLLLRTKRDAFSEARDAVRIFATLLREILKPIFGSEFNESWAVLGFVDSLAISMKFEDLRPLLQTMVAFLTANPAREVAVLNITAAHAQVLLTALEEAQAAVTLQETAVGMIKDDRDAKFEALRGKVLQLFGELSHLMDPLDRRWTAFGFNKPGAMETPDVPENVAVILIGPNAAATKWGASARAEYYRVWRRVIGVDAEPVAVGSPADLDFTLENLPAASTIEIYLSAVNNGGESQLSEKITIVTH